MAAVEQLPPVRKGRKAGRVEARARRSRSTDVLLDASALAVEEETSKFESWHEDDQRAGLPQFLGAHATTGDAEEALGAVADDIRRESWRWSSPEKGGGGSQSKSRRGVSDSLLQPTMAYLTGLPAVRDFEEEVRASNSLPDLPSADMSWVLAGEMPGQNAEPDASTAARSRNRKAQAAARQRQARMAEAEALREEEAAAAAQEAAAAEEVARQASLNAALRGVVERAWFEHDSSGYRPARPVGEGGWSQEDEDAFSRTADSLGDNWAGIYGAGWGFAMWPSVVAAQEMEDMLQRLEGGEVEASAVVEDWLAMVDVGGAQLGASFYALRYKLGVDQNAQSATAIVDACLALNLPKPPEGQPLRITVEELTTAAGTEPGPTPPCVVPAAIDSASADCGASAVRRLYLKGRRNGKPVYVLQTPPAPSARTSRREREASGEEWWIGFLLAAAALRASAAAAVAANEDDPAAAEVHARYNLHEQDSEDALLRCVAAALESAGKLDKEWLATETTKLSCFLRGEFRQRAVTDQLSAALRGRGGGGGAGSSQHSALLDAEEDEIAAQLADCNRRLAGTVRPADRVKLLATRAACHKEKGDLETCIADCTAALEAAEGIEEVKLPKTWRVVVLRLRCNAYEQLGDYDTSHADAAAAFNLSRSIGGPKSAAAEVEQRLFKVESRLRWPALAAAAQLSRPLGPKAPKRRPPKPSKLDALHPKRTTSRLSAASRPSLGGHGAFTCGRVGVTAEWLLEWSTKMELAGSAEWYTESGEGSRVAAHVMEKVTGGGSSRTAKRGIAGVLNEQGLVRPVATLCDRAVRWTNAKNKSGSAGDLNAEMPASFTVGDVIREHVVPATRLLGETATFADAFFAEGAGGSGPATHLLIHARDGKWWGLVEVRLACCFFSTAAFARSDDSR